jgi:hypothetical protein
MFKKLCIIVANSSASLIAKSSALLVADYNTPYKCTNPRLSLLIRMRLHTMAPDRVIHGSIPDL